MVENQYQLDESDIAMDLILLENQVPFFVLKDLFNCLAPYIFKKNVTLSQVLDTHLAPYIKLFRENNSTTDVDSHLPEKISTIDVDLDSTPAHVDLDSTPAHVLGYLHKLYQPVAAKSSEPKDAEASKHADEEQAAKSSEPKHAEASKIVDEEQAVKSSEPKHAEASKLVDEEQAAKSSEPKHAEASEIVDEEKAVKSSEPKHAEASKLIDEEQAANMDGPTCMPGVARATPNFRSRSAKGFQNCHFYGKCNPQNFFCYFRFCGVTLVSSTFLLCNTLLKILGPSLAAKSSNRITDPAFHSIVELDRSGMKFKPHQEDEWSMTIKFQSSGKPTLLMPTLLLDDFTELILRNFIAYEQSFPQGRRRHVSSYAKAMSMLIDTQEDIAKLVESKVLHHELGSNQEAADMINKICKNIPATDFYYTQEFKQLDKYYYSFWPKKKRMYFRNPWNAINLLGAFIVSLVTLVSGIFTVLQYFG